MTVGSSLRREERAQVELLLVAFRADLPDGLRERHPLDRGRDHQHDQRDEHLLLLLGPASSVCTPW